MFKSCSVSVFRTALRRRGVFESAVMLNRREMITLRRYRPAPDARWRLKIDAERCSDCAACVRVCPLSALSRRSTDDAASYMFDARRCNGCDKCAEICVEKAIVLTRAQEPAELLEAARLPKAPCVKCGQQGTDRVHGVCMICRQQVARLGGFRRDAQR